MHRTEPQTHTHSVQPSAHTSTAVVSVQCDGTSNSSGARNVAVQCACKEATHHRQGVKSANCQPTVNETHSTIFARPLHPQRPPSPPQPAPLHFSSAHHLQVPTLPASLPSPLLPLMYLPLLTTATFPSLPTPLTPHIPSSRSRTHTHLGILLHRQCLCPAAHVDGHGPSTAKVHQHRIVATGHLRLALVLMPQDQGVCSCCPGDYVHRCVLCATTTMYCCCCWVELRSAGPCSRVSSPVQPHTEPAAVNPVCMHVCAHQAGSRLQITVSATAVIIVRVRKCCCSYAWPRTRP